MSLPHVDESDRPHRRRRVSYHRPLVPVAPGNAFALAAVDLACSLAAESRARITLLAVIEVPVDMPLTARMFEDEAAARVALAQAEATANSYGLASTTRIVRGREAGEEIVAHATHARSDVIVLGAKRHRRSNPLAPIFGTTVQHVLKHAGCRVMVASVSN